MQRIVAKKKEVAKQSWWYKHACYLKIRMCIGGINI